MMTAAKSYIAIDETGEVATIEPVVRYRRRNRKWMVVWRSGRAPEFFEYLSDAKLFVKKLRHSHVVRWLGDTFREEV